MASAMSVRDFSERGMIIGRAYLNAPDFSKEALDSFTAFRDETVRQFEELTRRVRIAVTRDDPYTSAPEMFADAVTGRLSVLDSETTGGHPFLTVAENNLFRAVHDYYGHFSSGRGFDRYGEDAAWQRHSLMYSPLARRAMTTETRGQNSAMVFALRGLSFPSQKAILLPEWASNR